ncbi:hypothetical protein [Paenibacillus sp. 32352]|uniref:hypothetical protein n=1 Tax=Paenibacillus sp. 32352 TaxID=1969111 RepID=UPI0009ABC40D|nr:hypothetical protein [Paenibacillus sp. 32352]
MKNDQKTIYSIYVVSGLLVIATVLTFAVINFYNHYSQPYTLNVYGGSYDEESKMVGTNISSKKIKAISYRGEFDPDYKKYGKKYVLTEYNKWRNKYDSRKTDYIVRFKTDSIEELNQYLSSH